MTTLTPRTESPFSEGEEQELAAELLAVTRDRELDRFLVVLLRRAASAMGRKLPSQVGRVLGGLVKGALRKILPRIGFVFTPAAGGQVSQLTARAGQLLGFESEGLSPEDQEFNAATQLIRLAGAAAMLAVGRSSAGAPTDVARQAMILAAQRYAPGLVRSDLQCQRSLHCGCNQGGTCSCRRAMVGSWERRGRYIILHGI